MVEKHVKELLHVHDCVIIPEFGGLITRYASARIHPVKHTFAPPSKRLAFNEKLKLNDGLLINAIEQNQQLSREEAKRQVTDFVRNIRADLNENKKHEIKGVGVFRLNKDHKLEFEYADQDNFLNDSFGLPELIVRPIQHTDKSVLRTAKKPKPEPVAQQENRRFRRFMRKYSGFAASLLIGGLTMSAVYLFSLQTDYNLSSLTPMMLNESINSGNASNTHTSAYNQLTEEEQQAVFASILPKNAEKEADNLNYPGPYTAPATSFVTETLADENEQTKTDLNDFIAKDTVITILKTPKATATETVKKEVAAAKPQTKISKKNTSGVSAKNTMNEVPGRYYIITDAFNDLENAEIRLSQILNKGDNGKIIMPGYGSSLHRVSVADFASKEEADKKLKELRKKYGQSIWVLNY